MSEVYGLAPYLHGILVSSGADVLIEEKLVDAELALAYINAK